MSRKEFIAHQTIKWTESIFLRMKSDNRGVEDTLLGAESARRAVRIAQEIANALESAQEAPWDIQEAR